jgi:hypothetical protein
VSDAIIYNSILSQLEINRTDKASAIPAGFAEIQSALVALNPANWPTVIPKLNDTGLPSGTATSTSGGVFCVWDPVYNRCNSGCSWTVPAGISKVGFQLWGGGGGSSSGCCCGGHPGGSSGEFISVVMDVTPGDVYVLCNGCTNCCFGYWGGIQITGGSSCITGPGITTLCAQAGCGTLCSWSCSFGNATSCRMTVGFVPSNASSKAGTYVSNIGWVSQNGGVCRYQSPAATSSAGACFCNSGYDYCASSCAWGGEIPWIASHCTRSPTVIAAGRNPTCGWIPRIWPAGCMDTNHYGYKIAAPTVCFGPTGALTQKHPGSDCCATFTSGTCFGYCCSTVAAGMASAAFACMPGHGGVGSHIMGGNTNTCGDTGRGAAIRVTYIA